MTNNKVSIDLDIEDLLGLKEPSKNSLEYDLLFVMNNGIEEYKRLQEEEKQKDREFVERFKRNYDELCEYLEKDPKNEWQYLVLLVLRVWTCLNNMVSQNKRDKLSM